MISSSLEYFSISCQCWGLKQVIDLLQYTRHLQYLHVPLNNLNNKRHQKLHSVSSITMLKLSDVYSLHGMIVILQVVPNLTHLKVNTYYIDCDGYRWEELIDNYLPKLKVFYLRMHIELPGNKNNEKRLEKLLDTFRTRFWLEKHQWFIRCHQMFDEKYKLIILYTVPYGFTDFHSNMLTEPSQTTCPQNNDHDLYDRVKNLSYTYSSSINHLSFIQFSHIRNLSIDLCFDKKFWINVPIFYQLTFITILSTDDDAQFHLQSLLDRAPHLYSLTIQSWPSSQIPIVNNTRTSFRRLDLRMNDRDHNYSFLNSKVCDTLIRSLLAMHCEELLIKIANYESILDLINGMDKLRILQIQYKFGSPSFFSDYKQYEKEYEILIKWLQDHLPATCFISKSNYNYNNLKLWICLKKL